MAPSAPSRPPVARVAELTGLARGGGLGSAHTRSRYYSAIVTESCEVLSTGAPALARRPRQETPAEDRDVRRKVPLGTGMSGLVQGCQAQRGDIRLGRGAGIREEPQAADVP